MKIQPSPAILAVALASAIATQAAHAQQQAVDPPPGGTVQTPDARLLDTIIVTARKREEALQDVPVSVTVFSDEGLAERGVVDVNSLAEFTPGLSFSQAFGRFSDRPVIRGQGNVLANVLFGVESGTAYFIDGVYYNGDIQGIDFDSLQRVEVIKGPQSALYGRNTYAGAINFITREPGTDHWGGSARVTLGQRGEQRVSASINGPLLGDRLTARLGASFNNYDGEYTNRATGRVIGQEGDETVNLTLMARPADSWLMRVFAMHRQQEDGTPPLFLWGADRNNCAPGFRSIGYRAGGIPARGGYPSQDNRNQYYCGKIPASPELLWLNTDAIGPTDRFPNNGFADGTAFDGFELRETFVSLLSEHYLGDWIVDVQGGYRANSEFFGTDSDHSEAFLLFGPPGVAEPLFANTNRKDRREWSGEAKVQSPTDRPLQAVAGVYYYQIEAIERDLTFAAPRQGIPTGNTTGILNKAVYGGLRYEFDPRWSAGLELRYSEERKYREEINASGVATLEQRGDFSATTPRLTVDYKASEGLLLYGVFAQGVRPGGLNGAVGVQTGRPTYEQEESTNYEFGVKSTLFGGRMRLNGSVFFIDSKDVQVTQAVPGGAAGAVVAIAVNQARAETKGVELEMEAALTEGLKLTTNLTYIDPRFTEGCDDFEFVLNSGGIAYRPGDFGSPNCDISGNRLPLTSKTQASVLLSHGRPLAQGLMLFSNLTYSYEGSKYVQVHNLAETGSTSLLGARFGVRGERWSVAAYGRNLTNEDTVPMATRWFDLRYGGCPPSPAAPCSGPSGTAPLTADRGSPRAFFTSLRKSRTFGIEARYSF